jgi:hypothetical protein
MEASLKELRAKAKELRAKVSSAPISKATADQLKSEIAFFERAAKAEAQREQRMANLSKGRETKMASAGVPEKKKSEPKLVKMAKNTVAELAPKVRRMKKERDSSEE